MRTLERNVLHTGALCALIAMALFAQPSTAQSAPPLDLTVVPNPAIAGVPIVATVRVTTPSGPATGPAGLCIVKVGNDYCAGISLSLDSTGVASYSFTLDAGAY